MTGRLLVGTVLEVVDAIVGAVLHTVPFLEQLYPIGSCNIIMNDVSPLSLILLPNNPSSG